MTPTSVLRYQNRPSLGSLALVLILDWTTGETEYDLDLTEPVQQGKIDMIQGFMIDQSAQSTPTTIVVVPSGQSLTVNEDYAYIPVLCPNPPVFRFLNAAGTGLQKVFLYNMPIPGATWNS